MEDHQVPKLQALL